MKDFLKNARKGSLADLQSFWDSPETVASLEKALILLKSSLEKGGTVFTCGNGGSMCDAIHFAEEMLGKYDKSRRSLPAICLGDPGTLTCIANDFGFDQVFSRQIEALAKDPDILLVISTSGNSKNLLEAVTVARKKGTKTIGLLGKGGGELKNLVDVAIVVPSQITARIQEIHTLCVHLLIEGTEINLGLH
jgi:D-sedoheptulose 7-phosphate isomerase